MLVIMARPAPVPQSPTRVFLPWSGRVRVTWTTSRMIGPVRAN